MTTTTPEMTAIEQVLVGGDLGKLTVDQRVAFYTRICDSLDLNPLTKPFEYLHLNGKLVLYARKDCTEQLRSKRAVSLTIVAREVVEDCYIVTARASMPSGRQDESIGAVSIAGLKGEARANACMKAETKAKRRVTLSICGLGMLDETEVETIPSAAAVPSTLVAQTPASAPLPSELPPEAVLITRIEVGTGKARGTVITHQGEEVRVYDDHLLKQAADLCETGIPVRLLLQVPKTGGTPYLKGLMPVAGHLPTLTAVPEPPPDPDEELPF